MAGYFTQQFKSAAEFVFHRAGGLRVARWMHRKALRILMYHRFSNRAALDRQCAHIRKHYNPVAMSLVSGWLLSGDALPLNPLAVTVDDGYRDFLEVAFPVFARYEIPVTIFLVTDFTDRKLWLWVDQVQYAFQQAQLSGTEEIELPGGEVARVSLDSPASRRKSAHDVLQIAVRMTQATRLELLSELPRQLRVAVPDEPPPEYRSLSWDDVRFLAASGIEFGAHSKTHPILSSIASEELLREEVSVSKTRIECEVGQPVLHFCYPNGKVRDIGPAAVDAVRNAGFRTAVTAESGLNYPEDDPLLLRRIGAEPDLHALYFERRAAAFRV